MEPKKPFPRSRWRSSLVTVLMLFPLVIMILFACYQYYMRLQTTVAAENAGYLREISAQIGVNVGKTIEDNFAILSAMTSVLEHSPDATYTQLDLLVKEQQRHWNFQHVLLVDAQGVAHASDGTTTHLTDSAFLQTVVAQGRRSLSTSQMLGETECVAFALPLNNLAVDGIQMSALVATYPLSTFDQIISMSAFGGHGYSHIIRRDGTVVIRSSSSEAPEAGYNILSSLAASSEEDARTVVSVRTGLSIGLAGQVELTLQGVPLYMSYTPLEAQEWYLLTFVPTAVATEKSSFFLNLTLLLGALIAAVFSAFFLILLYISYRHKRKLEQLAFVDPVTGGNTIQRFYTNAAALLATFVDMPYALVYTNIDKFKILNEQLGRPACDFILTSIAKSIRQNLGGHECSGRLFADNFCVLLEYTGEAALVARLNAWAQTYRQILRDSKGTWLPITVEHGVYVVEDRLLPIPDMVDRAKLALREAPREPDAQVHYRIYDEQVRQRIFREKHLEDVMVDALEHHEFVVYLQPKYRTDTERIGGAEALVRWQNPIEGMIFPDEFISLFERNGFVIQLDLWVFEEVCKALRRWLDAGYTPVRISVNCSRIHLKMPHFLAKYRELADHYGVPPSLLEIEVTENVVFGDVQFLTRIIAEIHAMGFSCSMDDFGSGYSSLNLIQNIPVDVLKLDKIFFHGDNTDTARTESVVGSIIAMARALSMQTVAEGVEERPHVDMLKRLGCDYIQGYFFAKPMPIPDFEMLAFGSPAIVP